MRDILERLTLADYEFLVGLIQSDLNLTDDQALRQALRDLEELDTPAARENLYTRLEKEIRYLGSAELAYFIRYASGRMPGVPFEEVIRDAARALTIKLPPMGTERELLVTLAQSYATQQFARMSREEQQKVLTDLGVEQEKAAAFIMKSAGVIAIPALIEAFGRIVVQGLIKEVIFGTITRIIGKQLSNTLFRMMASRFPWWIRWIGPAAWTFSFGWMALDLQGPAMRKTIPVVLYLGLCMLREER